MNRYPLTNVSITASTWYACLVAVDRVAAIKNWNAFHKLIKRNSNNTIVAIFLFSCFFHLPRFCEYVPDEEEIKKMVLHSASSTGKRVTLFYENQLYRMAIFILNSIVLIVIPLLIISVFEFLLIVNFFALQRSHINSIRSARFRRIRRKQVSLATNLVLVSCTVFIMTEIFSLLAIGTAMLDPLVISGTSSNLPFQIISIINNFSIILRTSIIFLFYCMTCREYRVYLGSLVCWIMIVCGGGQLDSWTHLFGFSILGV